MCAAMEYTLLSILGFDFVQLETCVSQVAGMHTRLFITVSISFSKKAIKNMQKGDCDD